METIPHILIPPPAAAKASVIWLHGLGANGHDFEGILPALELAADHTIRFIFPHAPQRPITINNGMVMPGWYDITSTDFNNRGDEEGIETSVEEINQLIQQEIAAGVPAQKILLAGFSQGGVIALHAALRYPQALAGVMALSTYLPCVEKIPEARDPALAVFFAHGEYDPVVPYHEGERAHHTLSKLGYLSQWHSYPMEHSVCNEEITDLSHFIKHASRLSATKSNPGFCAPELPSTG